MEWSGKWKKSKITASNKKLTVEEAVKLSRLEVDFQIGYWGNVEWAHSIELHDTTARVAAAELFIQCNTSQYLTKYKENHNT
jgi:ATP synthase F1 complex assembly factor 2